MDNSQNNDSYFLNSRTADKWRRIGTTRRAGTAVPLYSLHSKNSIGVGEINDIRVLAQWCKLTGLSIIQLLPLNDVGGDFAPYNAVSSFAIDPMYITLSELKHADIMPFHARLERMRKRYRPLFGR